MRMYPNFLLKNKFDFIKISLAIFNNSYTIGLNIGPNVLKDITNVKGDIMKRQIEGPI
jgi:hypothetical protein